MQTQNMISNKVTSNQNENENEKKKLCYNKLCDIQNINKQSQSKT